MTNIEHLYIHIPFCSEKIAENFHFYSVFHTPETWSIIANGNKIGELPLLLFYKENDQILLAGKRWNITYIDLDSKQIIVQPSLNKQLAIFESETWNTSKYIQIKMREICQNKIIPAYVNDRGIKMLTQAFKFYDQINISDNILILCKGGEVCNTIKAIFESEKIALQDFEIGLKFADITKLEAIRILKDFDYSKEFFMDIINDIDRTIKISRKYDYILPDNLLDRMYFNSHFDVDGMIDYLSDLDM